MNEPVDRRQRQERVPGREPVQLHPLRIVPASDLLGAEREVGLMHEGALYRLRLTRAGKLILTK
ncbi:hemin uptake protein HemP [Aureimonas glaciei]|uniref:Hemin uptake protein HemP n=1 Tax=Aureimonas glaciei TaxID=1776957 RepID=A0A916XY87_9HYPH|nr:hemin uptake protein HemP [Aureimonas glaciei]GGD21538.1 hypothetical protein GCM10011335_25570 [Aureimonas glaciei]